MDLSNYKISKFNCKVEEEGDIYIFNTITGAYGKLDDNNKEFLKKYKFITDDILDKISTDDDLCKKLIDGMFLIPKDIDELTYLKYVHYTSRFSNKNSFGLTLIPTFACNFRCTYCFERDKKYPPVSMSDEVIRKTIKLVDKNIGDGGRLSVNWFGGEPLLEFDKLKKMQAEFINLCKKKDAHIYSAIITNGYLLNHKTSNELVELGISFVQITLDGPEKIHNVKRPLVNGEGTYKKIIENILTADKRLKIALRINIDKQNVGYIDEFLDLLVSLKMNEKKNINIYFSVVRDYDQSSSCLSKNCFSIDKYADEESKLYIKAYKKGFALSRIPQPMISNCGAISNNSIIIEPDGGLQKCWNAVGDKLKRVGHLLEKNDIYNINRIKWLGWDPFSDFKCRECKVLPMCMGGCPYFSIYGGKDMSNYECNPLKYNLQDMLKLVSIQSK